MKMESESQTRFFEILALYPAISSFWDRSARECRVQELREDMEGMSHGEKVMAKFFMAIWFHKNGEFSLIEAASVLDEPHRKVIAAWLRDPFWA
ncbi:hypothetical protein N8V28_21415 [Enterobacter hormaechei subsp. hoffmannii]|nr:hypothetical protein [Enterobacter hormaechei subsp. hoffmannii]